MKNKIKNFLEDIFFLFYSKLFSSKYVVRGKCKKCGNCCRNILFTTCDGYVKSKEVFEEMQKKYKYYRNFAISGVVTNKHDFQNGALTFKCKYISEDNRCKIYFFRPLFCRNYPKISSELIYNGVELLDECGFYIDITKKFSSYIK